MGTSSPGSPIGDTLPPLIVLGAEIDLAGARHARRAGAQQFYTGYRQTVLAPDELVTGVRIPIPKADEILRLYKVSRRKDLDISSFSAAICLKRSGGVIADVRIAFGGVGPTVLRMTKTEAALRGGPATLDRFERAAAVAAAQVTPISDVRGSERYRRSLAGNILLKFWHEMIGGRDHGDGGSNGDGPPGPAADPLRLPQPAAVTRTEA